MLVTLSDILAPAQAHRYAVIAPDFLTIGMLRHYLAVAAKCRAPLIASTPSLPIDRLRPFHGWVGKVRALCAAAPFPVCLHLDHGRDVPTCLKAIRAGFTSVMIDASAHDFRLNLEMTRQVVAAARNAGVGVEAEIGRVGGRRDSRKGPGRADGLTDPDQAAAFAAQSGVDALAVAIGTRHGTCRETPCIDFERLAAIRQGAGVPLVLHGASGTGEANIRRCVAGGICKINVFTDLIKPYLNASASGCNPLKEGQPGVLRRRVVEDILHRYFERSGSLGAAVSA